MEEVHRVGRRQAAQERTTCAASSVAFMYSQMPRSRCDRDAASITHVRRSRSFSVARRIRMLMPIDASEELA